MTARLQVIQGGHYDPRAEGAACDLCPLRKNKPVPPAPPESGKVRLVIVGEGPGQHEERLGVPFVGVSGVFLNRKLEEVSPEDDLRRDAWVTNATLCHPDGENDEKAAAVCCAPRLYRELARLPVDVPILALGASAARSLLNVKSILLARGFVWTAKEIDESAITALKNKAHKTGLAVDRLKHRILRGRAKLAGRKVFPTIHPAFVLRLDSWHPVLKVDVDRFARFLRGEVVQPLEDEGPYRVLRTPERVEKALMKLRRDVLSVDIETDGVDPLTARILCVGIGDGYDGVVVRWDDDENEKNRLIPQLAKILTDQFEWRQAIVMHNGYNFDQIALERDGVHFGDNVEDSLLAAHAFASHLPKRLDWVASIYTDSSPWKVKYGRRGAEEKGLLPVHMAPSDRHKYNYSDVKLTAHSWRRMQPDLDKERHIYEHDKQLAQITKEMQVYGVPVDRERRDELSLAMKERARELKWTMREMTGRFTFKPSRHADVRWALFEKFGAPVLNITGTGLPSTSNATLESLRGTGTEASQFADLMAEYRAVTKVKSTYIDSVVLDDEDFAHFNWRVFGTVSGRWSCRLQSCPRWSAKIEDRPREMYCAKPGWEFVYFDLSQSEMRAAAYLAGDDAFIATCETGDVHTGNAKILFPKGIEALTRDPKGKNCPQHKEGGDERLECNCGKLMRDIAKNSGFGVLYDAAVATIFTFLRNKGFDVTSNSVQAMFDLVKDTYSRYYDYCEENLAFCKKHGWQRTAILKRKRQIGYFPKPGDVYNFKVQSLVADLMNLRLLELKRRLPKKAHVVTQVHDALKIHVPQGRQSELVKREVKEIWAQPVHIEESGRTMVMPIDLKEGERWSSFG
jgi:uracil-DNA glycosylase family 4